MQMSRAELTVACAQISGGNLEEAPLEKLQRLITVAQHLTDLLLNEFERRGELTVVEGELPMVPYHSKYSAETLLTRR